MKRLSFKWILPVVAMPMLMASCNSDEPRPEIQQYVTIDRVGVGELQTRYDASDNFLPTSANDSLCLFIKSSNTNPKYSANYLKYTCDGSSWTPKTPFPWGGGTAEWTAIYPYKPYKERDKENCKIQFFIDPTNDDNVDLLYAYGTTSNSGLDVKFKHAQAKVRVNIYDKFTEFFFDKSDIEKAPSTIETVYTLGYVPEGYELNSQSTEIKNTVFI